MVATGRNAEQGNAKSSRRVKGLVRFALFAGTLIAAMVGFAIRGGPQMVILLATFPPLLPIGLFAHFVPKETIPSWHYQPYMGVGWLIYLGLSLLGTLIKPRLVFVTPYVIFVILLIVNLGGCEYYMSNMGTM